MNLFFHHAVVASVFCTILVLCSFADSAVTRMRMSDDKARTDAFMHQAFVDGKLDRMSVVFEQHGEVLYAYREGKGSDQPMHVASITKTVTAVLLTQLAEEGKIAFNDYVKRYIPLFPADDVTILHLMTHTSGWRNKTGHSKEPGKAEAFYGTMFKESEPGEKFNYMSQGYDILAEIIEKVTGVDDVADVAKSRIFKTLDMNDTTLAPHQGQAGMNTTAEDMARFGRALIDACKKRESSWFLSPEGADALFHPVLKPEFNRTPGFFRKSGAAGFGQYFSELNSYEAVGHAGATGCYLLIDPGRDAVEVILTGTDDWNNQVFRAVDGNFARINAVMLANFGDHPVPNRPITVGSAKPDQRRVLERELQALYSRRAAGEKVDGQIGTIERQLDSL